LSGPVLGSHVMTSAPWQKPPRQPRPGVASFLSFLWPGLGQWYAGRPRAAVLQAAPIALALAGFALLTGGDLQRFAILLFDPQVAIAVVVLVLLTGAWRLGSMADAQASAGGPGAFRGSRPAVFAVLVVVALVGHLVVASFALDFYRAGSRIFVDDPFGRLTPSPAPGTTPGPVATTPPVAEQPRINVLLTGVDSSESRNHALTDTLIVVSIDRATKDVAMVSFPRDIAQFPLWDGRTFSGKINSLMTFAARRPQEFPDGGMGTLTRELGYLLGIPIDYYAAINLEGFERLIDEVGGVRIVNDRAIADPAYGGWRDGRVGFYLSAGAHTLDGPNALAYVRSRKGAGDNDFTRARRQQQLLVALRQKLTDPAMLPRLSGVLDATSATVTTNFPPGGLSELLDVGSGIKDDEIQRYVLGPPYATHPPTSSTGGIYILALDFDKLAALSVELFGDHSRYAQLGSR
jgi:polyisoprenyl-teichoic acid--peptidoglycan teichoic acid transferase